MHNKESSRPNDEMDNLIYEKDWSTTPLGATSDWPQSLHTTIKICLISDSPACICWGNDLILIYNDAWEKFLGEKHPSALGQPARDVLGDNWQIFKSHFEDVLQNGEVKESRDEMLSVADEEELRSNVSFSPIFDENGRPKGVFTIVKETGSRDDDLQLLQSEEAYFDFFEHAPVAIHWLGPDGTILKANQAELDMLGYTRAEYIGRNIKEFFVKEEAINNVLKELNKGKEVVNYEGCMKHKDGSVREVVVSSNVLLKNGDFVHTRCLTRDITGRKKWERALEESESRYRTLVENFPKGAVGLFDENLEYTAVGGELLSQVGVTPEERVGNVITDIYPDELVEEFKSYFQDVFKGETNSFEVDFHERRLFAQTLPIASNGGEIIAGMLVVQDITERWQTKQDLRESEAKFRMMAENMKEVIWMVSESGEKFHYINPAFDEVWGVDRHKLYENPEYFLKYVHPDDRDRVRERFYNLSENDFDDEYRIVRPNGELRWLHVRGSKVYDKEGEFARMIGIAEDITERKHSEFQLRKSRNRLRSAFNIETVGILFWRAEGEDLTITEVNNTFLEMSGYSKEEVTGMSWRELTPEEFYSDSETAVADIEATGRTEPYVKQYIRKDGSRWWGLFAPRRIDENEAVEFVIDITERKQAQQQLEAMNATLEERVKKRTEKLHSYQKQLRSLASQLNVAEEQERQRLATELHDSLGQMLTLAKMKVEEVKHGQGPDQLTTGIKELSKIIDDAIKYSQNLMVELKPPPVLNKEDIREVLFWTVNKMEKQGLDITVEDDGKPKPVGEKFRTILHQSVKELFQNVIKHADTDKARLEISREKKEVKVVVEDKGKGFATGENQSLHPKQDRFGLFNIQDRIDWHGGSFEVHSEPGKGTKAVLVVPLIEEEEKAEAKQEDHEVPVPPDPKRAESDPRQKVKVILVDDHQMVRRGLRQMIEKQDDLIILGEASDGREAVDLAKKTSPDVIIMDVNMPVMDGIEATQRIRREMPNVKVIGLSFHESQDVIENMQRAGVSAYLSKKEAFESLITTIRAEVSTSKEIDNLN